MGKEVTFPEPDVLLQELAYYCARCRELESETDWSSYKGRDHLWVESVPEGDVSKYILYWCEKVDGKEHWTALLVAYSKTLMSWLTFKRAEGDEPFDYQKALSEEVEDVEQ